jgi:hypothetical protein
MRRFVVAVGLACAVTNAQSLPAPSPAPTQLAPLQLAPETQLAPPRLLGVVAMPEPMPPVAWSFAAGLATGLVSLAIGGALVATNSHANEVTGTYVIMSGLTLAPVVSHLVSREWGRAAIFGGLPALSLAGMTALLQAHEPVVDEGNKDDTRIAYVVLISWGILSAAGGLVDSLWAGERARNRNRISLTPTLGAGRVGLSLGGDW